MRIIIEHLIVSNTKDNVCCHKEKTIIDNVTKITIEDEEVIDGENR